MVLFLLFCLYRKKHGKVREGEVILGVDVPDFGRAKPLLLLFGQILIDQLAKDGCFHLVHESSLNLVAKVTLLDCVRNYLL